MAERWREVEGMEAEVRAMEVVMAVGERAEEVMAPAAKKQVSTRTTSSCPCSSSSIAARASESAVILVLVIHFENSTRMLLVGTVKILIKTQEFFQVLESCEPSMSRMPLRASEFLGF